MESSPYLQAIQQVSGVTRGEKFKTLIGIARKIADEFKLGVSTGDIDIRPSSELPGPLISLVRLLVAKLLKQPQGIVDVLKGDDLMLFKWALKVKWFFDGSIPSFTNDQYFVENIFPFVSLNHRQLIIKALGRHLKDTTIADEFYLRLSEMCGEPQAKPLLPACSETFIWDRVRENSIKLSNRTVDCLYRKYPRLIVNYLKVYIDSESHLKIYIYLKYFIHANFLKKLIKTHTADFIEIIYKYGNHKSIKLKKRHTKMFLRTGLEALMNDPTFFMDKLSLKVITSTLNRDQFKYIVLKCNPQDRQSNFNLWINYTLREHLKYFSKEEATRLFLSIVEECCGKKFIDTSCVHFDTLKLFSKEERIQCAKRLLESNVERYYNDKYDWMVCLSTKESIPAIKNEIARASCRDQRATLLYKLFETCLINEDGDALHEVFKYVAERHKNEETRTLLEALRWVSRNSDMTVEHWKILKLIVMRLNVKRGLYFPNLIQSTDRFNKLFVTGRHIKDVIQSGLTHDQPINEVIDIFIVFLIQHHNPDGRIWVGHAKILESVIQRIPLMYQQGSTVRSHLWPEIIKTILSSIYYINQKRCKSKKKIDMMSPENYDWLAEDIQRYISEGSPDDEKIQEIKSILKSNDRKLYRKWAKEDYDELLDLTPRDIFMAPKKDLQAMIDHWEFYYDKCKSGISESKRWIYFIKSCRWYQTLPIKFVTKCLDDLHETRDGKNLIFLACLLDGIEFERVIAELNQRLVIEDENQEEIKLFGIYLMKAFNIANPTVSLDTIINCFKAANPKIGLIHLYNFGRRRPVYEIRHFTHLLMESEDVSMKIHGIQLFSTVSSSNELQEVLTKLLQCTQHQALRGSITKIIAKAFQRNPCPATWTLMCNCLDVVTRTDVKLIKGLIELLRSLTNYLPDYLNKLITKFSRFSAEKEVLQYNRKFYNEYVKKTLEVVHEIGPCFPEECHQLILQSYFADMMLSPDILQMGQSYLIFTYILPAGDKLEARLNYYSQIFCSILKTHWNIPHPDDSYYYPANRMVHCAISFILKIKMKENPVVKKLLIEVTLNAFSSVLSPIQAPLFYLTFTFSNLLSADDTCEEIARKVSGILPSLIDTFTIRFMKVIAESLSTAIENRFCDDEELAKKLKNIAKYLTDSDDGLNINLARNLVDNRGQL